VAAPRVHPRHAEMKDDIRTTHAVRLGLREVNGFCEADARAIESATRRALDCVESRVVARVKEAIAGAG